MLLESAAVLGSCITGVFFALLETFVTGFIVLEEKMSSSKGRERDIRLVDGHILYNHKNYYVCVWEAAYPCHRQILTWSPPLSWTSVLV